MDKQLTDNQIKKYTANKFLDEYDKLCQEYGFGLNIEPIWKKSLDTGSFVLDIKVSVIARDKEKD